MLKTKYNYIYKTTNLINGKIYVGQHRTNKNPDNDIYLGSGIIINRAIKQYGRIQFYRDILEMCIPCINQLNYKELYWIKQLNSIIPNGYNIAIGSKGGVINEETRKKISISNSGKKRTEETKKRISEFQRGRKASEETKERMSISMFGKNKGKMPTKETKLIWSKNRKGKQTGSDNPFFGKHHSEETKKKLSEKHKGYKHTDESKKKISLASMGRTPMLGKKVSDETKLKRSISLKGKNLGEKSYWFGKHRSLEFKEMMSNHNKGMIPWNYRRYGLMSHTQETKMKISLANKGKTGEKNHKSKKVLQFTVDNQFIKEYPSVRQAAKYLNISSSSICMVCNKKIYKTAGGFIWKYKDEQVNLPVNGIARKAHNVLTIAKRDGTGLQDNSFEGNIWNG